MKNRNLIAKHRGFVFILRNQPAPYADTESSQNRRLTKLMRRELVKCLRTVALLAIFSQDSTTVGNIQSCLKSMSVMEPDLILHPILERAVPSLEALVEVRNGHWDVPHLCLTCVLLDSTDARCHQSIGCCCASACLAAGLLSGGQASRAHSAAFDPRN